MSKPLPDLRLLFGLKENFTRRELQIAWRKIARACHPDRNPDPLTAERFRTATWAKDILSDHVKLTRYDACRRSQGRPRNVTGINITATWAGAVTVTVDGRRVFFDSSIK